MQIYQLDDQNNHCNIVPLELHIGKWRGNHYKRTISVTFDRREDFEQYRYLPAGLLKAYPNLESRECTIKSATITFFFTEDADIRVSGNVYVQYEDIDPDTYVSHRISVKTSRIEIAKSLSWYFATSPEQSNHSINHLQSLYWRFVEWGFSHFSMQLEELDVEDQESGISALYDAFKRLLSNPRIPCEPQKRGHIAIHWLECDDNQRYSVHHYLFMDRNWRIFHYCEADGVMFDSVLENKE